MTCGLFVIAQLSFRKDVFLPAHSTLATYLALSQSFSHSSFALPSSPLFQCAIPN